MAHTFDRNKAFLDLWIQALKSGVYSQYRGFLASSENARCCLGVACELDPHYTKENFGFYRDVPTGDKKKSYPPHVARWGITKEEARGLAILNDEGATFEEIARVIEYLRDQDMPVSEREVRRYYDREVR